MDRAELLQTLRTTPDKIGNVAVGMTRQHMLRKRPDGEWTIPEILKHLALYEREVLVPRVKLLLSEENPTLPPQPEMMGPDGRPPVTDFGADLAMFRRFRLQTLELLNRLDEAAWRRIGQGRRGPTTIESVVGHAAEHDLEHLQGMEEARQIIEDETEAETGASGHAGDGDAHAHGH